MSAASAPLIRAAHLAGGSVSQDRHVIGERWAIVLDGASSPEAESRDGGWYAEVLGAELDSRLRQSPDIDLPHTLHDAIASIAGRWSLVPGNSPSSTVAILRWNHTQAQALVLGDSPIIAETTSGIDEIRDDRLASVGKAERQAYRDALRRGDGYTEQHQERLRRLVAVERSHRNTDDGYWISEATPEAAHCAVHAQWDLSELRAVLLVSDGVARGIECYERPETWGKAFEIAGQGGPGVLLQLVLDAEAGDPHGQLWPRSKPHDDKTAVLANFGCHEPL